MRIVGSKKMLIILSVILFISISLLGCGGNEKNESKKKEDAVMELTFATGAEGGTWGVIGNAIADYMQREIDNVRVTVIYGGGVSNLIGISNGQIDIAFGYGPTALEARQGLGAFKDTGPIKNVRQLAKLYTSPFQIAVRGDSGVYKVEDLKGKGFSPTIRGFTSEAIAEMVLKVHGMTYDDLSRVEFVDQPEGAALTQDGHIAGFCPLAAVPAPAIQELFASSRGGRIVPIAEDKIEAISEINSGYIKYVIPAGSYRGQTEDVLTIGVPDVLYVREDLPDELVTKILEIMFNKAKDLEAIHVSMKDFNLEEAPEDLGTPLHSAAEAFYKAKGALK
ncbi:MAG: TAXI family TRAP transporter solute-binding subunit [Peptococcales bacterium]|jgi:TRAP transporter TAXI family solute receptor